LRFALNPFEYIQRLMSQQNVEASGAEPSPRLTTAQRQRVDEAFVELFGYPFSHDESGKVTASSAPPPRWLCDVLSSEKQAAYIWRQLSLRKQRQLATRVLRKQSSMETSTMLPFRAIPNVSSTSAVAQKNRGDEANVTTRTDTERNSTTDSAADAANNVATTSVGSRPRTSLAARVHQLTTDGASTSTLAKTALDWEVYKEEHAIAATLEEQATKTTAYLPKQEFLQRVDVRTYEKSRSEKK
jgi:Bucentaur or craniofacial development